MKNLAIGLFILGLTSLGYSQNFHDESEEVVFEDILVYSLNKKYINEVMDNVNSDHVKDLEFNAANYNITKLKEFDGRSEFFKVLFKGDNGKILATYDSKGKIVSTSERYKDIALPVNITKSILSQFPNSNFLKVVYTVDYNHLEDIKKTYKIQIVHNDYKKTLKIHSDGNLDKTVTMSIVN